MPHPSVRRQIWRCPSPAPRRRPVLGALSVGLCVTFALAGCGTSTIDRKKAEALIRNATGAQGHETPNQITCPSGVTAKKGATFECQVSYTDGTKGTVTEHIVNDSGRVEVNPSDLHLTSGPSAGQGGQGSTSGATGPSGGTGTGGSSGGPVPARPPTGSNGSGSSGAGSSGGSGGGGY